MANNRHSGMIFVGGLLTNVGAGGPTFPVFLLLSYSFLAKFED